MAFELYNYQQKLITSRSKFSLVEKSRQIGISYALGYIGIEDGIKKRMTSLFQSMDAPKGINYISDCKEILLRVNPKEVGGRANPYHMEYEALSKEIRFENGGQILSVSSDPDATRAYNGNVFMDEGAFQDDFARALTAATSCTDRGDGRLIAVSTHNGAHTDFNGLCTEVREGKPYWEHHFIDLRAAMADNYHRQIVRDSSNHVLKPFLHEPDFDSRFFQYMRDKCPSQAVFDQEYLCKVQSTENQIITREMYDKCVITEGPHPTELPDGIEGEIRIGIDIGLGDSTVCWAIEDVWHGEELLHITRAILRISKATHPGVKWTDLLGLVMPMCSHQNMSLVKVDATGVGQTLAQELEDHFGSVVEKVNFNQKNKAWMIENMRGKIGKELVTLPDDRVVREDLESFSIEWTKNGPRYNHGNKETHGDFGIALALALSDEPMNATLI